MNKELYSQYARIYLNYLIAVVTSLTPEEQDTEMYIFLGTDRVWKGYAALVVYLSRLGVPKEKLEELLTEFITRAPGKTHQTILAKEMQDFINIVSGALRVNKIGVEQLRKMIEKGMDELRNMIYLSDGILENLGVIHDTTPEWFFSSITDVLNTEEVDR